MGWQDWGRLTLQELPFAGRPLYKRALSTASWGAWGMIAMLSEQSHMTSAGLESGLVAHLSALGARGGGGGPHCTCRCVFHHL